MKTATIFLTLVIGVGVLVSSTASSAVAALPRTIVNKSFNIAPGRFRAFPFFVHPRGGRVYGKFRSHNVECFIVDEDGFENFRGGSNFGSFYTSGRVSVATIDVALGEGQYYLIFNNKFSIFSTKTVAASVSIDFPR